MATSASRLLKVVIAGDATGALGEFKKLEAGTDGLGTKLASLGQYAAIGAAGVAAAAVGIGVGLFKVGESFDEAYDKIRAGTGAVGGDLEVLKDEFKKVVSDVPTDFGKASDAVTIVTQKLGISGDAAGKISEQFLELSRITKTDLTANLQAGTDALNAWQTTTAEQGPLLDEMFRATQLTGISFADLASQLASSEPVLKSLGLNVDQSVSFLANLKTAGADVADVMPALSKSLATAAKDGKDAGTVLQETFDRIKNAPDGIVAAQDAMEVFGKKAGPKFAELVREGKLDYQGLMGAVQDGTDTIIGAGKETQDFGEKWELIKNRVLVALEPIAMKVFDAIGKAMDRLGPYVQRFGVWFNENLPIWIAAVQPWLQRFVAALAAVGSFIVGTVMPALVSFGAWLVEHKPILEGIAVAVGVLLVGAFVAWAASATAAAIATIAAAAPVILITAAIAALTAAIIYAYENWDWFRTTVDTVATFLTEVLWPALQSGIRALVSTTQWLVQAVETAWSAISGAISFAWDNVIGPYFGFIVTEIDFLITAFGVLEEAWSMTWNAIGSALQWVWDNIISPIINTIHGAIDGVTSALGTVGDIAKGALGPAGAVLSHVPGFNAAGTPSWRGGLTWVGEAGPELVNLPGGTQIHSYADSMAMTGGSAPTCQIVINAGLGTDPTVLQRAVVNALEDHARHGGPFGSATKAALAG